MDNDALIRAIQALSHKSVLDYLQIALPLLLSTIAIILSLHTARKQNKIALFEKRMAVLNELSLIICFAESLSDLKKPTCEIISRFFNSGFGVHIEINDQASVEKMYNRIKTSEMYISMAEYVFDKKYDHIISTIMQPLVKLMENVICNKDFKEEMYRFISVTHSFAETDFKAMCKKTKL